jgi:hypothetical protein
MDEHFSCVETHDFVGRDTAITVPDAYVELLIALLFIIIHQNREDFGGRTYRYLRWRRELEKEGRAYCVP